MKKMKVFTSAQVKDIDSYTIAKEPIKSIDLMERAAKALTTWLLKNIDTSSVINIFAGPGNNGGDALAVARLLIENKYKVRTFFPDISKRISTDCKINLERLKEISSDIVNEINIQSELPVLSKKDIIIDGIFGSGLTRPVEGLAEKIIKHINDSDSYVISIDIPSGLFGEDNRDNIKENIIKADYTLTFQFPFLSFFFAENACFTGNWEILDIGLHPEALRISNTPYNTLESIDIKNIIKPRQKFTHKGTYGHALIIAGSYGMMGAAILCARACIHGGVGLLTMHVPQCGYEIMQISVPEALINTDHSVNYFSAFNETLKFNAVGIGPGMGCMQETARAFKKLLNNINSPLVIDADALNILANNKDWLKSLPPDSILTPHPGEFDRLCGPSTSMYERYLKQLDFSCEYKVFVVLKGYHTIITSPDKTTCFNTTGNPGMASGGSGDVLTGLIVSFLAQSYSPADAAKSAVFLHGLAGDMAKERKGEESMTASDIINKLGKAFLKIKQ